MSFILDALKKSESDRQRQSGPALFEVKVAPPRSRLPLWAVAIGLLLAVNLGVVAWMLLRHPSAHEPAAAMTTPAPAVVPAPAVTVPPASVPPASTPAAAPSGSAAAPTGGAAQVAPVMLPATSAPAGNGSEPANPEDLAPAAEAPAPLTTHVQRGTVDGVPLYQDWAASSPTKPPELRLDLHVYAQRAEERFVMINMKKLREGEALPNGVRLESITPEGAVLSYNGARFLLTRN
jgi:general secretion pathway protein B